MYGSNSSFMLVLSAQHSSVLTHTVAEKHRQRLNFIVQFYVSCIQ